MVSPIIPIRAFIYPLDTPRFLYHSITVLYGGQQWNRTVWTATLVVDISIVGSQSRFTLATRKVWGSRAGMAGILLPSRAVLTNMFGTLPVPGAAACSIELVPRSTAKNPITWTDVVNLGVAP